METKPRGDRDWVRLCLIAIALTYALLAGLRTVSDLDLGWQLATGRYLVQHHQIPRLEMFSYTAQGKEWIYPPFSGALFYLLYLLGSYSTLSCFGALMCAAAVFFVTSAGGRTVAALSIVAVPVIAFRTIPRAEMFTTVFFSAVLAIIWRHHYGKPVRLWLLPLIFLLWANVHLGFISGLGLFGAAVLFEAGELLFAGRRAAALSRLKNIVPWMAACFLVTLINPWGWRIYQAIDRQNKVMQVHSAFIGEWSAVHLNTLALRQALEIRDPVSADWWLLCVAAVAVLIALWKKRFGPAIVLALGMYLSLQHIRLQALFAVLAVVIGGTLVGEFAKEFAARKYSKDENSQVISPKTNAWASSPLLAAALILVCFAFASLRIADLLTNRYYIDSAQISLFGTGPSWWYPQRAADFLKREGLPRNVFHDYNLGGYLTWQIGPEYPDFVDGRYIPFGEDLFNEQKLLAALGPDSPEWHRATDRWQFNTAIFSVARYAGLGTFALQEFCASKLWTPVYLDDVAIIFVRNSPGNAALIQRLGLRCETASIAPPKSAFGSSFRDRAERFNYLLNASSIYYFLSQDAQANSMLAQAEQIFPDDPSLHLTKAQMLASENRLDEAEREYLRVIKVRPSDSALFALARLYAGQQRYPEALQYVKQATELSLIPYDRLRSSGVIYVRMNQPQNALDAFDRAEKESPYRGKSSDVANEFNAKLAEGRANAYKEMNQMDRAISEQKLATSLTPESSSRWATLAELYGAQGQTAASLEARQKAQALLDATRDAANLSTPATNQ
jgi:tetratricopeptide (TPR) repeat protein